MKRLRLTTMVREALFGPCKCRGWSGKVEVLQAIAAGGHHPNCPHARAAAAPR